MLIEQDLKSLEALIREGRYSRTRNSRAVCGPWKALVALKEASHELESVIADSIRAPPPLPRALTQVCRTTERAKRFGEAVRGPKVAVAHGGRFFMFSLCEIDEDRFREVMAGKTFEMGRKRIIG